MSGRRSAKAKPTKAKPTKAQPASAQQGTKPAGGRASASRRSGRRKGLIAVALGLVLLAIAAYLFIVKSDSDDSASSDEPAAVVDVVMPDFSGKGALEALVTLNKMIKDAGGNKVWRGEATLGVVRAQTPEAGEPFSATSYALAFENGLVAEGAPNPCSWDDTQQTWQAITNNSTAPIYFFWRNTDCRENQFMSLGTDGANLTEKFPTTAAPGRTVQVPTFVGQRIVVKDPARNVLKQLTVAAATPCPSTLATSSLATTNCSAEVAVP